MAIFRRKYQTKDGKVKESANWSYEFQECGKRFQGTINGKDFRTKRDAEKEEARLRDVARQDILGLSKKQISFNEGLYNYYDNYLKKLEERRGITPHKSIKDRWEYIIPTIAEYFENTYFENIDRAYIGSFIGELRKRGKKDSGIKNYLSCFQAAWNYNFDLGLHENFINFKSLFKILRKEKVRTRYLNEEEYDALIYSYVKANDTYRERTRRRMVEFDVETGLRLEELVSTMLDDIDLFNKKIKVINTKNGKDRIVPLSTKALEVLASQIADCDKFNIKSRFLFCKRDGSKYQAIKKGFKLDLQRAKLNNADIRIHDLRRTFGTWRLQGIRGSKKTLHEVSKMLGHSSIKQTEKAYAFLDEVRIVLD